MVEVIAALGAGAHALFNYNRKNFMFDQEQRIKREYQGQDMRVKQFELYREDVRDLVGLTIAKMDNYLIVNTLQLGFCVALYTEGRLESREGTLYPDWMLWLYMMSISGAFLYLLMSVWLAMHASIAAHSFGVRLLTQFVRLPVPSVTQIDAARAYATDYEGKKLDEMLRVPIWKQQAEKLNETMSKEHNDSGAATASSSSTSGAVDSSNKLASNSTVHVVDQGGVGPGLAPGGSSRPAPRAAGGASAQPRCSSSIGGGTTQRVSLSNNSDHVTMLEHVKLYRQLQANWQSYDAYARVAMSMGTNQLLHALTYYVLGYLIIEAKAPMVAYGCAAVFTCASILLARLDLYLHRRATYIACSLLLVGPVLSASGTTLKILDDDVLHDVHRIVVPLSFLAHLSWIIFVLTITRAQITDDNVALPTTFRSVLYLDVFGWYDKAGASAGVGAAASTNSSEADLVGGLVSTTPRGEQLQLAAGGEQIVPGAGLQMDGALRFGAGAEEGLACSSHHDEAHWVDGDFFADLSTAQMIKDCRAVEKDIHRPLKMYAKARDHEQLDRGTASQLEYLQETYEKARTSLKRQVLRCSSQPASPRRRASVGGSECSDDAGAFSPAEGDEGGEKVSFQITGDEDIAVAAAARLSSLAVASGSAGSAPSSASSSSSSSKQSNANPEEPRRGAPGGSKEARTTTDWIEIVWSEGFGATVFYYDPATKTTKWDLPPNSRVLMSLSALERLVTDFAELVEALGTKVDDSTCSGDNSTRVEESPSASSSTASSHQESTATGDATTRSQGSSQHLQRSQTVPISSSSARDRNKNRKTRTDRRNPAQECRFGGREGVDAGQMQNFVNRPLAAASFHPFPHSSEKRVAEESNGTGSNGGAPSAALGARPGVAVGSSGAASSSFAASRAGGELHHPSSSWNQSLEWLRRKREFESTRDREMQQGACGNAQGSTSSSSAPPGLLPWKTFFAGSVVLVGVWSVGLIWSVSTMLFGMNVPGGQDPYVLSLIGTAFADRGQVEVICFGAENDAWNDAGDEAVAEIEKEEGREGDDLPALLASSIWTKHDFRRQERSARSHSRRTNGWWTTNSNSACQNENAGRGRGRQIQNAYEHLWKANPRREFASDAALVLADSVAAASKSINAHAAAIQPRNDLHLEAKISYRAPTSTDEFGESVVRYQLFQPTLLRSNAVRDTRGRLFRPTTLACGSETSCFLGETYRVHHVDLDVVEKGKVEDNSPHAVPDVVNVSASCAVRAPVNSLAVDPKTEKPILAVEGKRYPQLSAADRAAGCSQDSDRFFFSEGHRWQYFVPQQDEEGMEHSYTGAAAAMEKFPLQIASRRRRGWSGAARVHDTIVGERNEKAADHLQQLQLEQTEDPVERAHDVKHLPGHESGAQGTNEVVSLDTDVGVVTVYDSSTLLPLEEFAEDRAFRDITILNNRFLLALRADGSNILDLAWDLDTGKKFVESPDHLHTDVTTGSPRTDQFAFAWQLPPGTIAVSGCGTSQICVLQSTSHPGEDAAPRERILLFHLEAPSSLSER